MLLPNGTAVKGSKWKANRVLRKVTGQRQCSEILSPIPMFQKSPLVQLTSLFLLEHRTTFPWHTPSDSSYTLIICFVTSVKYSYGTYSAMVIRADKNKNFLVITQTFYCTSSMSQKACVVVAMAHTCACYTHTHNMDIQHQKLCWTHSKYITHMHIHTEAEDLPNSSNFGYRAWLRKKHSNSKGSSTLPLQFHCPPPLVEMVMGV